MRRHGTIYEARTLFFKPTSQEVTIVRKRKVVRFEVRVEAEGNPVRYKYNVRQNEDVEERNYGTQSFQIFVGAESRSEWYWFPEIFQTWFAQQNTNFKLKCALFFELPGRTFCHAFQARQIPFPHRISARFRFRFSKHSLS